MVHVLAGAFGVDAVAPFHLGFSLNTAEALRRRAAGAGLGDIQVRFDHRTAR
jgi:hypothetical protein